MIEKSCRTLFFLLFLSYSGYAIGTAQTEENASTTEDVLTGNIEAGKERYKKSCINCHGAAGKGVASYPKVSGQVTSYTKSKLETYRDGITVGPNSSLMIMMAKPLTDEEITNLAAYLKSASTEEKPSPKEDAPTKVDVLTGSSVAGEERYKKSCINCHGAAGKGVASYPKVSGQEISYTKSKLETYRDGITIGPNSSLMIMMAKPLTDEEIANLATYLKEATH